MNPFLNPISGLPFLKYFLFDTGRIKRLSPKDMDKHRNKSLRKIVKYAYTVPLYHKKYREANIHPDDIKEISDIEKLPFVTRKDIDDNYPDGIVPEGYNKKKAQLLNTSGSTGKPVSFFTDFKTMAESVPITIRGWQMYKLNWRKSRFAYILNYGTNSLYNVHSISKNVIHSNVNSIIPLKNHQYFDILAPLKIIIKKLDEFKPDFIVSNPDTYYHLAFLKNKGYGKNINPKILATGGSILDINTRKYIQDSFGCNMHELYGSVESSSVISIECFKRCWHIQHDYYHIEAVDENGHSVEPNKKGKIVLTRLYGKGTPFVRYTGLDDTIMLSSDYKCDCGLNSPIFKGGIEGRPSLHNIILKDGRLIPAPLFSFVPIILKELKTMKIKQYQIIQKNIDEIGILIEIDENLRNIGPSIGMIFDKIEEAYKNIVGPDVKLSLKEVKKIKISKDKPFSNVISYVKPEDVY